MTRIAATGNLSIGGERFAVKGEAWMDREFFSSVPGGSTLGWDWMCVQLNNNEELMLYELRTKDGGISSFSSGTFVDSTGKSTFLTRDSFSLEPLKTWHSPVTGGDYPISWQIKIPSKRIELRLTTALAGQELVNRVTRSYWEGSVQYRGMEGDAAVTGVGYLEMTGYDRRGGHKDFEDAEKR
jgi:predicted secreted hydrolase